MGIGQKWVGHISIKAFETLIYDFAHFVETFFFE